MWLTSINVDQKSTNIPHFSEARQSWCCMSNWLKAKGQKILRSLKLDLRDEEREREVRRKLHKIGFVSNDDQPNWNYPTISLNILQVTTFQTWHSDVDHAIQTLFDGAFVLYLFIGLSLSFLLLFFRVIFVVVVVVCVLIR